jgi:hypothetical protein
MNDHGWWTGARNWWATRSVYKKAEATRHLSRAESSDGLEYGWRHAILNGVLQAVEIFAVLFVFLAVVFLLIWLF